MASANTCGIFSTNCCNICGTTYVDYSATIIISFSFSASDTSATITTFSTLYRATGNIDGTSWSTIATTNSSTTSNNCFPCNFSIVSSTNSPLYCATGNIDCSITILSSTYSSSIYSSKGTYFSTGNCNSSVCCGGIKIATSYSGRIFSTNSLDSPTMDLNIFKSSIFAATNASAIF